MPGIRTGQKALARRCVVVVLGMHRSGTSALTRGIAALGAELGERLTPPAAGNNEKGFWEDADLMAINDRVLAAAGCRWDSMNAARLWSARAAALAPLRDEAARALRERCERYPLFAFKDPRTCITLPFWQSVFVGQGVESRYVISFRNPLSVALSLEQRDGFSRLKSYHLWLLHVMGAVVNTRGQPRVFIEFDSLLADPREQLLRIVRGLDEPRLALREPEATRYVEQFIEKRLRNHVVTLQDLAADSMCPTPVARLYALLRREASGESAAWDEDLDRARALLPYGDYLEERAVLEVEHAALKAKHSVMAGRVDAMEGRVQHAEAFAGSLHDEVVKLRVQYGIDRPFIRKLSAALAGIANVAGSAGRVLRK